MVVGASQPASQPAPSPSPAPPAPAARPISWRRLVLWSLMVAAIGWTLLYQAGKGDPSLPEFVYVAF